MAFGEEYATAEHPVAVHDLDVRGPRNGRLEREQVVVIRRPFELAADIDDDEQVPGVLDVAVRDPALAEQLSPPHLKEDEVVRMMQESHAIRLGVTDPDGDLVAFRHGAPPPLLCSTLLRSARTLARRP